jgi:hypothetical protein
MKDISVPINMSGNQPAAEVQAQHITPRPTPIIQKDDDDDSDASIAPDLDEKTGKIGPKLDAQQDFKLPIVSSFGLRLGVEAPLLNWPGSSSSSSVDFSAGLFAKKNGYEAAFTLKPFSVEDGKLPYKLDTKIPLPFLPRTALSASVEGGLGRPFLDVGKLSPGIAYKTKGGLEATLEFQVVPATKGQPTYAVPFIGIKGNLP